MVEDGTGNTQDEESSKFLDTYMNTPDIGDRISIAERQFESNTDAWILTYYANANMLPQTTLEVNTRVRENQVEHQRPANDLKDQEAGGELTFAQTVFKELDQYQTYYNWAQKLAENGGDDHTKESVSRMLEITKNIVRLHFYYDDLDVENRMVIDWFLSKVESGDVSILTTIDSTSEEYTDLVNSLSKTYKSPMFLAPQAEGGLPQMFIFPDLFDKSMTEFDLLTHLAHERAHDVYFQNVPPKTEANEEEMQRYLVFHEYLAILESQRSYRNLDAKFKRGLSEGKRKFFAESKVGLSFEIPGYRDQITTELNPESFALYHAYRHALETKINAHMSLVLSKIQKGELEEAKMLLQETPGSSPPVGGFVPVKG